MVGRRVGGIGSRSRLGERDEAAVDEEVFEHSVLIDQIAAVVVGGGDAELYDNWVAGSHSASLRRYHAASEDEVYGPQRLRRQRDTDWPISIKVDAEEQE